MTERLLDSEIVAELVLARRIEDGQRVRKRREGLGLKLAQLGALSDLSESVVCRIELGQYTPRDAHKVAIAAALATEVHDLWQPLPIAEVRARALEMAA